MFLCNPIAQRVVLVGTICDVIQNMTLSSTTARECKQTFTNNSVSIPDSDIQEHYLVKGMFKNLVPAKDIVLALSNREQLILTKLVAQ